MILIDPWLRVPTNPDKAAIDKLERVDYILVTHGHWDHIGDAVEIGKKTGAILVAPYGLQFNMKSVLGYPEKQATLATGGNVGGTFELAKAGAKVTLVHAVHGSELVPPMVKPAAPGAPAAIASGNPVGYVLRAAHAVEWVNPRQVVPMHFGTYQILAGTPAKFKEALDKRGLGARMIEMKPGETRNF